MKPAIKVRRPILASSLSSAVFAGDVIGNQPVSSECFCGSKTCNLTHKCTESLPITTLPNTTLTGRGSKSILDKTIRSLLELDESGHTEGYTQERGLLQFVDPRFKLVGMRWLDVCVILVTHVEWILAILSVTLLLAVASKVRLVYYLKRV